MLKDEVEAFHRVMAQDSSFLVWALKYLEAEETKSAPRAEVTQRLRALIDTHHVRTDDYLDQLKRSAQSSPGDAILVKLFISQLRQQEHALVLSMFITTPSQLVRTSFTRHIKQRSPYRIRVRELLKWMLGLPILSARQWSRAIEMLSECNAHADGSDSPTPDDPTVQAAAKSAPTSRRPSRGHHGSPEEGGPTRSREDRAPAPRTSIQQGNTSAPPYPRGDLIDQVASKKASRNQTRQFHSQAVHHEAFYQQAMERLGLYSATSEEGKRKKLRAVLEGVKVDRLKLTAAVSSQQTGQAGEEEVKSKASSPTRKGLATSEKSVPSLTWEERLAQRYRQDLDQLNPYLEELERASEIKSLGQVSTELKVGIRTMYLQSVQQLATAKRTLFDADRAPAPRGTAEAIDAVEKFHRADARFIELKMLAAGSGSRANAKAKEVSARLVQAMSSARRRAEPTSP